MSELPIFESLNQPVLAQTLASDYTSAAVEVKECRTFTIQPIASGSSILGSVQLTGSTDGVNYGNMGSAISLATDNLKPVNYPDQGVAYLKVVFTAASGTGSLTVNITCKR